MKLFLKRLSLFLLPVFLIGLFIEFALRNIPNDYSFKSNYLYKNASSIKVLILGSSHTYFGVNPELLNEKAFNAAHNSQSLDFDFSILDKYESKWDSLKLIIIPIDYLTLYYTLESGPEPWRMKYYSLYYSLKLNNHLADNTELFSSKLKLSLNRLNQYYIKKENPVFWSSFGWGSNYGSHQSMDLVITGKNAALRHTYKDNERNSEVLLNNIKILEKFIEFAKTHNVRIMLITCPVYQTYMKNLNPTQLGLTISTAINLEKKYKCVSYVNFLNDESFREGDFYDADHLNDLGATKFSVKIDSIVKQLGKE